MRWTAALQISQPCCTPGLLKGTCSLHLHRFSSTRLCLFQTHCGSVGFTWTAKAELVGYTPTRSTAFQKIFIIVQLPGTHTYRHISGNWQPSKTFVWLLILPQKSLWDTTICWISDQASLSHSSCQFTFLPQMSLQFKIITNGCIRIRSLLHRQTELMC